MTTHEPRRPLTILMMLLPIAMLALGCERAPDAAVEGDSSVVDSTTESPQAEVAEAEAPSAAGAARGSFAFVDSSGTRLLALDSLPEPSTIVGALCSGGIVLPVRYDRKQVGRPNDDGRQRAYNFPNGKGDVFRVTRGKAPPDKTCYLSSDSALISSARVATMREPSNCSPAHFALLLAAKHRQVIHCWHIAVTAQRLEVLAVQFVTIDTNALASLVLLGDSVLVFQDFPAVHNAAEGGGSTWRVDDEGEFSPKDFDVLFVAALPYGFVMAIGWAGAEGESCQLLLADSGDAFRTLVTGYRYWAPL